MAEHKDSTLIAIKVETDRHPIVHNHKILVGGLDISSIVWGYTVTSNVGELQKVELRVLDLGREENLGLVADGPCGDLILTIAGRRFRVLEILPE